MAGLSEVPLISRGVQGPVIGIVARPDDPPSVGVLVVAGQPQTRIGAHRMFVTLARGLARQGIASYRFDCGGWGDSPGKPLPFEGSVGDIAAAAVSFREHLGHGPKLVVLGLCDGASAALLSLETLRINGLAADAICLINPWVRQEKIHAEALLKSYYSRRLVDLQTWRRLLTGKISWEGLLAPLRYWRISRQSEGSAEETFKSRHATGGLPEALLQALQHHRGAVWSVLSGNDLTAAETEALLRTDLRWRQALKGTPDKVILRVAGADHTFTTPSHWQQVIWWLVQNCQEL